MSSCYAVIMSFLKYWLSLTVSCKSLKPVCFSFCPPPGLLFVHGYSSLLISFGLGANFIPQLPCSFLSLPDQDAYIFSWLFGRQCPLHLSDDLLRTQGCLTASKMDAEPSSWRTAVAPQERRQWHHWHRAWCVTGGAAITLRQRRWQETSRRERRFANPLICPTTARQIFSGLNISHRIFWAHQISML